jgi:UDP-GlcNAc3NAcA epimerase
MNIITIIGARPQFIKAAVVSRALVTEGVSEKLVHTGQHFDANMSGVFFEELEIPRPAYHLGIGGGTHGQNTGRMVEAIEKVLFEERPDWVLVYGDTDSTLAGALAAVKLHIPVAHVEAGLRSFNRAMPEEINRVLTDHVASLLLAPTDEAVSHLANEGISGASVCRVGDVMYDAALFYGEKAKHFSTVLSRLDLAPGAYALTTIHRAENTNNLARLRAIVGGLAEVAQTLPVVWPLHPRTRGVLARMPDLAGAMDRLHVIDPVGYLDMVALERAAAVIATDSGGVQKEAFFYEVPCVTLRGETEWVELVEGGWNRLLSPTGAEAVAGGIRAALGTRGLPIRPYGEGDAARRVVARLLTDAEA